MSSTLEAHSTCPSVYLLSKGKSLETVHALLANRGSIFFFKRKDPSGSWLEKKTRKGPWSEQLCFNCTEHLLWVSFCPEQLQSHQLPSFFLFIFMDLVVLVNGQKMQKYNFDCSRMASSMRTLKYATITCCQS